MRIAATAARGAAHGAVLRLCALSLSMGANSNHRRGPLYVVWVTNVAVWVTNVAREDEGGALGTRPSVHGEAVARPHAGRRERWKAHTADLAGDAAAKGGTALTHADALDLTAAKDRHVDLHAAELATAA